MSISIIPISTFTRDPAALYAVSNIKRTYLFYTITHIIYDFKQLKANVTFSQ